MRSLNHVLGEASGGHFLPDILPALAGLGIKLRKGTVTMIAAPPNGGKSAIAHWYAVKSRVPTLFFSADTDSTTMLIRTAAMNSGRTQEDIEALLDSESAPMVEDYIDVPHIRWCFEPNPSLDEIFDEVEAYSMVYCPPDLIVVDNLVNVAQGSDNEWTALRDAMNALHTLARDTGACIVVLHHVSEADTKPGWPPPRKAIMGKPNQMPEMILTLGLNPVSGDMRIAPVKNRHGIHDVTGSKFASVAVDLERMTFYNSHSDWQQAITRREWQ